jgi:hypothetical protein
MGNYAIYKSGHIIAILQIVIYKYGQIIAILQIIKIPLYMEFLQFIKAAKLLQFCKLQFIKTVKLLQFCKLLKSSL